MKRNSNNNDRRDGEGRSGGRRDDARPFNRDNQRAGSDRDAGSRPAYPRRDDDRPRSDAPRSYTKDNDRKPYGGSSDGPRKPYKPFMGGTGNHGDSARKPFERKPYAGGERKPYDGERKPYGDKPRSFDRDRTDDRKPFDREAGPRNDGPRKPYAGGDRRDDRPRDGDRSTFERRPFNRDDKPRSFDRDAPREPRSFDRDAPREPRSFDRDRNDSPRPARSYDRDERKPFDRGERPARPFERDNRNDGPRDNRDERPARPFERKPYAGGDRNDDRRPFSRRDDDRRSEGPPREPRSFDRDERKPVDRSDEPAREPRPRTSANRRDDRNDAPRAPRNAGPRSFDRRSDSPRDERPRADEGETGERHIERRTGYFKSAPNYNMDRMKENLPQSRKVARNLERERKSDPNAIRLNRYIANAGICSRREADELIAKGDVQVNGTVITEMGYRVKPGDVVKYGNKVLNPEKMVYLLLNKPKDYITTTEDPEERNTVMDLIADAGPFRLYPVGRLDRNTTGLLLMTNDGELAGKLTHPSNNVKKVYQVEIDKPITDEHFEAIRAGVELEDGFIKPDDLAIVTPDAQVIGVEIHSGRNRIVRRMFEHFGYVVTKLDRTVFAGLTKKELPRGKWRFLEAKEVVKLKYLS
ncbi:pseudouridine synthase [Fibrella sp. HMF5335]|uniref:Pseudouridine synthase n=1 Tax=Fibrella rubiginis TaxID=2817060 RepID=A0A939K597_9BACT|nr:pseudouridine synthase [Fibrella rubiginis]MBO0936235.1 pseudouridine synthase [Fibrella rubiginis]